MWADKLVIEYQDGRRELQKRDKANISDQEKINSMITSMSYSIDWMKVGRDPEVIRGIDISQAYQKKTYGNMDIFPASLQEADKEMDDSQKQSILNILMGLTARERECFILNKAYMQSYADVAKELGITRSSVQKYVERAKKKISCHADVMQSFI